MEFGPSCSILTQTQPVSSVGIMSNGFESLMSNGYEGQYKHVINDPYPWPWLRYK